MGNFKNIFNIKFEQILKKLAIASRVFRKFSKKYIFVNFIRFKNCSKKILKIQKKSRKFSEKKINEKLNEILRKFQENLQKKYWLFLEEFREKFELIC